MTTIPEPTTDRPAADVFAAMSDLAGWEYAVGYAQGYADGVAETEYHLYAGLLHGLGGPTATTAREAVRRHQTQLDQARARRERPDPPPWVPVDWPDAVVRLPGESPAHYQWRTRQQFGGAA